ncbi:tetratricopeptide repeat protein [Dactylosporangium sp. NPDC051484]|uniref:tetratricopeptide repeat protein n=1 Tax=Dactylosporangium sp. NPDC051484 TaxID=3154942 RepID=UPI00344D5665
MLHDLGDLNGARTQHEHALRISEAALGPDHPTTGIRRSNLGMVLRALGDLNGARTQYEQALRIGEAALGPQHRQTLAIRTALEGLPPAAPESAERLAHRKDQP